MTTSKADNLLTTDYEKQVLFEPSQIYYWIYKCTTCHH